MCGLVTGVVRNVNFTCVTQVLDPAKAYNMFSTPALQRSFEATGTFPKSNA